MKIFDVTRSLCSEDIVYPGDRIPFSRQRDAGNYLISDVDISSHSGTHIDAPSHFLENGISIDEVPLSNLIGRCRVLDVGTAGTTITEDYLKGKLEGATRILLRTRFSGSRSFVENYPSLDITAARMLSKKGIRCIGIDSPSVESFRGDGAVHREILGHGCSIIEMLDLAAVEEGEYTMAALPLRLRGLDGSPARIVLLKGEECELWT